MLSGLIEPLPCFWSCFGLSDSESGSAEAGEADLLLDCFFSNAALPAAEGDSLASVSASEAASSAESSSSEPSVSRSTHAAAIALVAFLLQARAARVGFLAGLLVLSAASLSDAESKMLSRSASSSSEASVSASLVHRGSAFLAAFFASAAAFFASACQTHETTEVRERQLKVCVHHNVTVTDSLSQEA